MPVVKHIWVVPFENATGADEDQPLMEGIAGLAEVFLSQRQNIGVVDRDNLIQILKEQHLPLTGYIAPARAAAVGKLAAADDIMAGNFSAENGRITIHAHLYTAGSGKVRRSAEATGDKDDLAALVRQLTQKLMESPGMETAPVVSTGEQKDLSPMGNLHFMQGLSHYYSAQYSNAVSDFVDASKAPEIHDLSRFWLAKAYIAEKQYDHAYVELKLLTVAEQPKEKRAEVDRQLKQCTNKLDAEQIKFLDLVGAGDR